MSRVDKFNPLAKRTAIDQKRDALRGGTSGKALMQEPKYAAIRGDAITYGLVTDVVCPIERGEGSDHLLGEVEQPPNSPEVLQNLGHSPQVVNGKRAYSRSKRKEDTLYTRPDRGHRSEGIRYPPVLFQGGYPSTNSNRKSCELPHNAE